MLQRTVIFEGFHEKFEEVTQETKKEVEHAIGYLAYWAIHNERYAKVNIRCHHDGDITAVYRNNLDELTYDILAQRQENGNYSFHS